MDQLSHLRPLPASPDSASPMWAAVGHYLAHHRGHHVPLAALLRAPWRCLLNLAGGPGVSSAPSATARVLLLRTAESTSATRQND